MAEGPGVALLTNFVAPYRVPVLRTLAEAVGSLRVLVSTPMEGNRDWAPEWEGLDVVVQSGLRLPRRRAGGFRERIPLHVPLDTARQLDRFDPDVVIAGEMGGRTIQAARWCRKRDRPLVVWATLSERTERAAGFPRRLLRRLLLGGAAAVIVNGQSGAAYVRSLGFPDARIHRVNQASPVGARLADGSAGAGGNEDPAGSSPLRLIAVGQLVERKGLEPLMRELGEWADRRDRHVVLTVVGGGPLEARLRGLETAGRLDVRLAGPVAFDAVAERYAAADVMVFPTLADEWGLVVNEAMTAGLPVLGSVHAQAVTELVEEGRTGWTYDPEEPGALAAALDRLAAAGPGGWRAMGEEARRRVAGLTPARMAGELLKVIEDVGASGRSRP